MLTEFDSYTRDDGNLEHIGKVLEALKVAEVGVDAFIWQGFEPRRYIISKWLS